MQVLYVVEFEVRSSSGNSWSTSIRCIRTWLEHLAQSEDASISLEMPGVLVVPSTSPGTTKSVEWEPVKAIPGKALRVQITDRSELNEFTFHTRVTLSQFDGKTRLRVSMARQRSNAVLSSLPPADLRQPGLLRELSFNSDVKLYIQEAEQDSMYALVRSDRDVEDLRARILDTERLPLLLVHTRTTHGDRSARVAARKLLGLVTVATLDYRASRRLGELLPNTGPPLGGASLLWSDDHSSPIRFGSALVNSEDSESLRSEVMRIVAPVSVLSRGSDVFFQRAVEHRRDERLADLHRSNDKERSNQLAAEIEVLREDLKSARESAEVWETLAEGHSRSAQEVIHLRQVNEQLQIALREATSGRAPDPTGSDDPWSSLPALTSGDRESMDSLLRHLADASSGTFAYTNRALTSWKSAKYPNPEEMREALAKLARAADSLYGETRDSMPLLNEWFRTQFDLRVSTQDDTIERSPKMWKFHFEGHSYDRTPHVKVADATSPSAVGRIHFAMDSDARRFIVDHIGTKLY